MRHAIGRGAAALLTLLLLLGTSPALAAPDPVDMSGMNPSVRIAGYKLTDGTIAAGETFTITVTLANSNAQAGAYNILGSYYFDGGATLQLQQGVSNQFYFEKLDAGKSVQVPLTFTAPSTLASSLVQITFELAYYNNKAVGFSNSSTIQFNVSTPEATTELLRGQVLSIAEAATVGSRALVSVQAVNQSQQQLSSVVAKLEGDIPAEQKTVELGTLEADSHTMQDGYVTFLTAGDQTLTVTFTYKDSTGKEYSTAPQTFHVQVSAQKAQETNTSGAVEEGSWVLSPSLWSIVAIGSAAVVLVVLIILLFALSRKGGR